MERDRDNDSSQSVQWPETHWSHAQDANTEGSDSNPNLVRRDSSRIHAPGATSHTFVTILHLLISTCIIHFMQPCFDEHRHPGRRAFEYT